MVRKDSVGQALIRQQHSHKTQSQRHGRHGGSDGKQVLESVTDSRDLDDVIEQAELAGRVFSSLNPLPEVLVASHMSEADMLSPEERKQQQREEEALYLSFLKVPRRPNWQASMTPEELDAKERHLFVNWRRELAKLEQNEKLIITPFEKNLDIWRQLWRVLERSDLVVTVVDARNPLFYRCPDLEVYVREIDPYKRTMLLVNKADLLPSPVRVKWAKYFRSQGISFIFWSAKIATAILEGKERESDSLMYTSGIGNLVDEDIRIFGREELLDHLQSQSEKIFKLRMEASRAAMANHFNQTSAQKQTKDEERKSIDYSSLAIEAVGAGPRHVVVGFVGYPNVGKSSTVNALVGEKRTGVTSTPGKTKHFQTFIISDKLMLCDCPGLVFPSFTSSRSDMVASGVLPIDRLTDHRGPVQVVADLVPREKLEEVYGIILVKPKPYEPQDRPPTASELLRAFAHSRGYVAGGGLADETRAARQILKDYINGKLIYYYLPPDDVAASCESVRAQLSAECSETEESCCEIGSEPLSKGVDRSHGIPFEAEDASTEMDSNKGVESSGHLLKVVDDRNSGPSLSGVLDDLALFDTMAGLKPSNKKNLVKNITSHKMHKKAPRRKDRSWRVGNDGSDGMPLVSGVQKSVSYGAARLEQKAV